MHHLGITTLGQITQYPPEKIIQLSIQLSTDTGSGDFQHSKSLDTPTNITLEMYEVCTQLFKRFYDGKNLVRRVTVSLTNCKTILDRSKKIGGHYANSE